MPLPWVRLDSSFPTHDKVLALLDEREGHRAGFVYVCSLAYAGQHGTDGLIPYNALPFIHARKPDTQRLVAVGLWVTDPAGWRIPNYLTRQQSQAASDKVIRARSIAGAKGNCVRWHGEECGCWLSGVTEGVGRIA